jgi:hypothetical protein
LWLQSIFGAFVKHEIGHLTTQAHCGAGLGRVTIIPDGCGKYWGSASPGDQPFGTERVARLASGQVAEGRTYAEPDRNEQDTKKADGIIRADVMKDTQLIRG